MTINKERYRSTILSYNNVFSIHHTRDCLVQNPLKNAIKHSLGLIFFATLSAHAASFNDYYVTIEPTLINYKNKQDVGTTQNELVTYPASITFSYDLDRIDRVKINLRGINATFPAGKSGFGVDTSGYQVSYIWDRKIRLARDFKPWFGGGLVTGFFNQKNRQKTDADGFVTQTFADKNETVFSLVLNASVDWELTRTWYFNLNTLYEIPVTNGLQGFGVGAGIKYRF